jgi:hypothetical protein
VLEVNPNAVVVIQSGTPVTMPWADNAKALVDILAVEDAAALRTEVQIGGVILQAAGEGDG